MSRRANHVKVGLFVIASFLVSHTFQEFSDFLVVHLAMCANYNVYCTFSNVSAPGGIFVVVAALGAHAPTTNSPGLCPGRDQIASMSFDISPFHFSNCF